MRQRRKIGSEIPEIPETLIAEEKEAEEGRFFACYLLTSRSPRYKGHTYIGFTVNPRRRIRQHNGEIAQGAWRTKRKRPWEMVLCIYGFPTNVSALQFEWAWQNPTVSKAVRQAAASFKSLGGLISKIKLAYTMLTLPPWQSLNITVNFFSSQYTKHSAGCPRLPEQMKVKVCSMDELPSCTKLSDDLLENEDEWCNEREFDEDMNTSTLHEETISDFMGHNSADDQQSDSGNRMNEVYGCSKEVGEDEWYNGRECDEAMNDGTLQEETLSDLIVQSSADDQQDNTGKTINKAHRRSQEVGEDCTEQFGFIASPVRTPSSNVTTSFDTEVTKDIGSADAISVKLGRPAMEQLTTVVADHQSPSRSYLWPRGAEVIDLTTPAPLCRSHLCGKKSGVAPVYPQIIDLTKSPNFVQL
ncbi:uncharacterized protein Pyn_40917 [Prunus yedoensis var. nudiflora]|uniref:Structure-specific endonuclease subunit SLX1 homolog n=1 Tax=Prunus yedoensis var. nudiflora TaxID=2094558 RepID=A0A314US10_PRUYE|nr:uncharacterized protein Pyn_40917 [Prunus yedoensis var. nudiflora]